MGDLRLLGGPDCRHPCPHGGAFRFPPHSSSSLVSSVLSYTVLAAVGPSSAFIACHVGIHDTIDYSSHLEACLVVMVFLSLCLYHCHIWWSSLLFITILIYLPINGFCFVIQGRVPEQVLQRFGLRLYPILFRSHSGPGGQLIRGVEELLSLRISPNSPSNS